MKPFRAFLQFSKEFLRFSKQFFTYWGEGSKPYILMGLYWAIFIWTVVQARSFLWQVLSHRFARTPEDS